MPDKYRDLMMDDELNALGAYLSTLKNSDVKTPRPIFVKSKVEHGFTVYGYVRDASGKAVPGVDESATTPVFDSNRTVCQPLLGVRICSLTR